MADTRVAQLLPRFAIMEVGLFRDEHVRLCATRAVSRATTTLTPPCFYLYLGHGERHERRS